MQEQHSLLKQASASGLHKNWNLTTEAHHLIPLLTMHTIHFPLGHYKINRFSFLCMQKMQNKKQRPQPTSSSSLDQLLLKRANTMEENEHRGNSKKRWKLEQKRSLLLTGWRNKSSTHSVQTLDTRQPPQSTSSSKQKQSTAIRDQGDMINWNQNETTTRRSTFDWVLYKLH